ncbi:hypothetical protein NFHSH190041_07450 [Shewanella sp. NFH-SH190041]|nr:hypothetical protein NFHSH190041_07450 [Shewanella sp. NFH-SH190041]
MLDPLGYVAVFATVESYRSRVKIAALGAQICQIACIDKQRGNYGALDKQKPAIGGLG